jgi:asparagine N-glycosylation enzyme membrane subunit Stt3
MEILILSLIAGSGLTFSLCKIFPLKKMLHYDYVFDILFTLILPMLLIGSMTGMMIAILTGITLSIELWILKKIVGSEPLNSPDSAVKPE